MGKTSHQIRINWQEAGTCLGGALERRMNPFFVIDDRLILGRMDPFFVIDDCLGGALEGRMNPFFVIDDCLILGGSIRQAW